MTVRERKIWGYTGLIFYFFGLVLIVIGSFDSINQDQYWFAGLTAALLGWMAVTIALIEKIWSYLRFITTQNTYL